MWRRGVSACRLRSPGGHIGGIAVDAAGNIYAAVDRLQKPYIVAFDANGTYLRSWQAGSGTGGIYRIPLTLGPDGLIYIIPEESVDTVKVFTTAGTLVRQLRNGVSHPRPERYRGRPVRQRLRDELPEPGRGNSA